MVVQPGGDVTLRCSNKSTSSTDTFWSRLVNRTRISCIASTPGSNSGVFYCEGYKNGKFKMTSNISDVFLKIKQVDSSDSGMYFCGFKIDRHTVFDVVHLDVQGKTESLFWCPFFYCVLFDILKCYTHNSFKTTYAGMWLLKPGVIFTPCQQLSHHKDVIVNLLTCLFSSIF